MTRTDDDRVAHILEAIDSIERWTATRDHDELYRSGVLHQLEIIGEASSHLSDRFKDAHPSIPWRGIIGFRIRAAHRYWDTEWSQVERTIAEDLPTLRDALATSARQIVVEGDEGMSLGH
ncbi:MAG: DUF86 domain-containing protein [Actinomycetota bacterium]|nr:DUF86 domain-containing protein [Actinomycetota bacterium]